MLETINLESASGIIANFTGGDDLSFTEIMEALTYLQHKTNTYVDLIPGVITDQRMEGRAQVTLVITGIGGSTMDSAMKFDPFRHSVKPTVDTDSQVSSDEPAVLHQNSTSSIAVPQFELAGTPADLDVPAFLRRRIAVRS